MTALAQKRHRRHANPFTLRGAISVPVWPEVFGRDALLAIDVGCGPGHFLTELGRTYPQHNVLGLEIRQHLVDNALQLAKRASLPHIFALLANANAHLPALLAPGSVALMSVNFPDPWYKKRHHKRRVVNAQWLAAIAPSLVAGADFYAMSDYLPVAEQMRQVLGAHPSFENQHPKDTWPEHSLHGLTTEREQTHIKRGEPIYRMHFKHRPLA